MLRVFIGLVVGLAVGICVGWVVFDDPFADSAPTKADVEREVARVSETGYANCTQRQYPESQWDCSTDAPGPSSRLPRLEGTCPTDRDFWTATVTDEQIRVDETEDC